MINAPGCMNIGDTLKTMRLSCEGTSYTLRSSSKHCGGGEFTVEKVMEDD